jgi:hypothetical protein
MVRTPTNAPRERSACSEGDRRHEKVREVVLVECVQLALAPRVLHVASGHNVRRPVRPLSARARLYGRNVRMKRR